MKNLFTTLSAYAVLAATPALAQTFEASQVKFWVGSGPDSTVLVIDFHDSTDTPSFAWGFRHNGAATAEDMLNAIDAADENLTVDITGGFLNSITYGTHSGIGGAPNWWGTWSGSSLASLAMNQGISEVLANGSWFGCSYTDFDPALAPTIPVAAIDPLAFTAADVLVWAGSGPDSTVLVVDFQEGGGSSSFAWGYLHEAGATGEMMVAAIAAADPTFIPVVNGGFLSDLTYGSHAGIGGAPDWWSTWNATNMGDWAMNMGLGTELGNGDFFGLSYTDFNPALAPGVPQAAPAGTAGIRVAAAANMEVWPQPATDVLQVRIAAQGQQPVSLVDMRGTRVFQGRGMAPVMAMDVKGLAAGLYVLQVGEVKRTIAVQ